MELPNVGGLYFDHSLNLNSQGVNSSGAVAIRNALIDSLSIPLPITLVFEHNTLEALSEHIVSILKGSSSTDLLEQVQSDVDNFKAEIDLSNTNPCSFPSPIAIKSILLTGATGFVGSHLLAQLIISTQATIHCIIRAKDAIQAKERVIGKMKDQQCWTPEAEVRVVAHVGDLLLPNIGLSPSSLSILASIDFVYHAGAVVNWVLPYSQMKENVKGGIEIVRMLSERGRRVPFHFISSIGSFAVDMAKKEGKDVIGLGGYPLSKWAAEQVLGYTRSKGLPVTIFR